MQAKSVIIRYLWNYKMKSYCFFVMGTQFISYQHLYGETTNNKCSFPFCTNNHHKLEVLQTVTEKYSTPDVFKTSNF